MEKFEKEVCELEDLNLEDLMQVTGGSQLGYWVGYAAGKAANGWTDFMNRNASVFLMM